MPTPASDKYPTEERRRFVKGVVGAAGLLGVTSAGTGVLEATTETAGAGGGRIRYVGIENVDGPAPRAMPQIPVEVDGEGYVKGVFPDDGPIDIAGIEYRPDWFQYCGVQTYPGISPEAEQDDYFKYDETGRYGWPGDGQAGRRVHIEDFEDYETWTNEHGSPGTGKPASVTWRSAGAPSNATIPVELIRSPLIERMAATDEWLNHTTDRGFLAHLNKCTHFCCVPGFKTSDYVGEVSATDRVYCQCHQSIYDPFSLVTETFVALPRPDG